ncbi:YegP family protein [Leadbetterella byssophila]|uniref:YegP family protein n=1 Tax=Leadbetterella byssophila TaxID=316068 RepID=UPI0039A1E276
MGKFEIFLGIDSQYYFRFVASNGRQIISSEGYKTRQGCEGGVASVKRLAPYDSTYRRADNPGNYRFNMVAENGEIIARSSEGYVAQAGRENAIEVVKKDAPSAFVF